MADYPHYSNYHSLTDAILAFGQLARDNGIQVGVQESLDAVRMAEKGIIGSSKYWYYGLKTLFCCSEEDGTVFDELFDWFWGRERNSIRNHIRMQNQSNIRKNAPASLVLLGTGKRTESEDEEDSKNVSGANAIERLRKTDFSRLSEMESAWLEEIAMKLWKQMGIRLKRKLKKSSKEYRIDLRQTIRRSIAFGGEMVELQFQARKPRKQRLIVLLDVSGSMDKYSFFLLRFLCALRAHFEKMEAFIFSTQLIRISAYLNDRNLDSTLATLSQKADVWSGGTKIGGCLQAFNEQFAGRVLNGHSTVIILSDGLDTGEPQLLAAELQKINLRTRKLIWLNPLKGMTGYQPVQQGMRAALPEIDVFRSAHNLDSILELEKFLLHV